MRDPYTWLLFDADGTLFDYRTSESAALGEAFAAAGLELDPESAATYARINAGVWEAFERAEITQEHLRVERFRRLVDELRVPVDPFWWSGVYLEALGRGTHLLPGALDVLDGVRANHRLALITNGLRDVQRSRLALSPIGAWFEAIVISEEVGVAKPDPAIFDAAFRLMGAPEREDVLMVGDSLTADIAGALAYGIDTCWVNPGGLPVPDGWAVTHQIAGPADLVGVEGVRSG